MPTQTQLHGMLLEEALLHLLRYSGYRPVETAGTDPTLRRGSAGLEVRGRGECHQIDAIADFAIPQPFTNPSRLLVEAKFKDSRVSIDIVRNAVGVLKDVSEYWGGSGSSATHPRYHYQYAILASSGYSNSAQRYALAHDVFLIQFKNDQYFRPIMNAIRLVGNARIQTGRSRSLELPITLQNLRRRVREMLSTQIGGEDVSDETEDLGVDLESFIAAVRHVEYAVLATAVGRLPLVLTPRPGLDLETLAPVTRVRIFWDELSWYLRDAVSDAALFSFDLPKVLSDAYGRQGELSALQALSLKGESLSRIEALVVRNGTPRLLRFDLDQAWLQEVREAEERRAE